MLTHLRKLLGNAEDGKLGTFAGVFTPSVLTILGVIMYLRLGWVVGHAGLAGALIIVLLAHLITIVTGLSISAVATNRVVGPGGAYFMVSRSLGTAVGGAVGIPLFVAQALSFSLYVMGFTEALLSVAPGLSPRVVSTVVCVFLTLLSLWSAEVAIKTQYLVMIAIVLSLLSFGLGAGHHDTSQVALWSSTSGAGDSVGFATVFAVFFPAVTGITAGISMSGDLRNPHRAIPRGTMLAIAVGLLIYALLPVLLSLKATPEELRNDMSIMQHVAWIPALLLAGIWGATLSSAVGSILGAPRTLQALARDGVLPRFLGRGHGTTDTPRIGTIFSFAIAEGGVLLGDLNLIAPILTMFFLVTYGMLNLSCALESWANSPNYRPEIRAPALISLAGAGACLYMMFFIDAPVAAVAVASVGVIYAAIHRKEMRHGWGDARHAIWAALIRMGLLVLRRVQFHPRNWRPNAIVLGGVPASRPHLVEVAFWLAGEKGLVTYFHLVRGSIREERPNLATLEQEIDRDLGSRHPWLLTRVHICSEFDEGVRAVAQSYGFAGFQANTIIMGWQHKRDRASDYGDLVLDLMVLDKCILIVDYDPDRGFGERQRIDIWWGGLDNNGGLMLLVAQLLTDHVDWRRAEVRLRMIVSDQTKVAKTERRVRQVARDARLIANVEVLAATPGHSNVDLIAERSADADLVILGMRPPLPDQGELFVETIDALIARLPTVLLVRASQDFEGAKMVFD